MHLELSPFRFRSFITLVLFLSFLAAASSGVALYMRPEGSLARWINWSIFGLDKKHWETAHTMMVLLFFLASVIHLWYNWKSLTNCIRSRAALIFSSGSRLPLIKELLAAVTVVTIVFGLTIFEQQPFMTLIDLRTEIKDGRFSIHVPPPVADADRLTFEEFCLTAAIDKQEALQSARSHGIVIDNSFETIAVIAEKNRVSPEGIFKAIRND